MTVDNSQIARRDVIILEANPAPATLIYERGQTVVDPCCLEETSEYEPQAHKPSIAQEQQQQQQSKGESETERSNSPAPANNKDDDAAARAEDPHHHHDQQAAPAPAPVVPKWVRVGEKVCFSTVVAAVLIPSSHDLTAASKRELWWQSSDYADFRVNYATHMHNPALELEEQERETAAATAAADQAPVVPAAVNADSPAATATATVEGVLVVNASPAPAPLAPRSVNPNDGCRRSGGGASHKVGAGAGGGSAARSVSSQDRLAKSSRYERVQVQVQAHNARPRSVVGGGGGHHVYNQQQLQMQQQQMQRKVAAGLGRRHHLVGEQGYTSPPPHRSYAPQAQFPRTQQQQQSVMMRAQGHPGHGHAAGFGRRDARHDRYLAPCGMNDMNRRQAQQQPHNHHGRVGRHGQQQQQQQFFVNGNPAGVNIPPPQQQQHARVAAHPGAFLRGGNGDYRGNDDGSVIGVAPPVAAYAPRGAGGISNNHPRCGAAAAMVGGGAHMPAHVPVQAGNPSQFSMWRSQLVFAPVMQMQ